MVWLNRWVAATGGISAIAGKLPQITRQSVTWKVPRGGVTCTYPLDGVACRQRIHDIVFLIVVVVHHERELKVKFLALFGAGLLALTVSTVQADDKAETPAALKFKMKSIDGKVVDLAKYQGKVVMIVNLASQ